MRASITTYHKTLIDYEYKKTAVLVINFIFLNLTTLNFKLLILLKRLKKFRFQTLKVKLWTKKRNFRSIRQRRTTNLTRGAGLLGLS